MKMHEYSPLGADPRCESCGHSEQDGNHSIVVGGGLVKDEKSKAWDNIMKRVKDGPPVIMPAIMGTDMARDEDELVSMPERGPEFFMEMKLDRARIGLKLLDHGDDEEVYAHLVYPGIPITRTVQLDRGNTHYLQTRELFQSDLTGYLAKHGVKAEFLL